MRTSVSTASSAKDCMSGPAGIVAPSVRWFRNIARKSALAATPPATWLNTYGKTSRPGSRPASQNPPVTAGFRCAPDTSPTA